MTDLMKAARLNLIRIHTPWWQWRKRRNLRHQVYAIRNQATDAELEAFFGEARE